jgi:retinol dehydrogenase-14
MSLQGKTALVTGANSGIGLEACVKLARAGAHVAMVSRNPAKGQAAVDEVKRRAGGGTVSLHLCDFGSQKQIRKLASDVQAAHSKLDILINNAGSVSPSRVVTEDGLEQTFAVNHLGYFLLTGLLTDLLKKSAPARIVNVASVAHRHGDIDFDNLQYEKGGYGIMGAYARSKLGNVLFTAELARRLAGTGVTATTLHPGAVATEIWGHAHWFARPFLALAKLFMITSEQGGDRIVYLAAGPEVEGHTGGYYERNSKVWPSKRAQDEALAKRLWDVSAQLSGLA